MRRILVLTGMLLVTAQLTAGENGGAHPCVVPQNPEISIFPPDLPGGLGAAGSGCAPLAGDVRACAIGTTPDAPNSLSAV